MGSPISLPMSRGITIPLANSSFHFLNSRFYHRGWRLRLYGTRPGSRRFGLRAKGTFQSPIRVKAVGANHQDPFLAPGSFEPQKTFGTRLCPDGGPFDERPTGQWLVAGSDSNPLLAHRRGVPSSISLSPSWRFCFYMLCGRCGCVLSPVCSDSYELNLHVDRLSCSSGISTVS